MAAFVYSLFKHRQTHAKLCGVAEVLNQWHLLSHFLINLSLNRLPAYLFFSFCLIRFYPSWRTSSTIICVAFFCFPSLTLFLSLFLPFSLFSSLLQALLSFTLWSNQGREDHPCISYIDTEWSVLGFQSLSPTVTFLGSHNISSHFKSLRNRRKKNQHCICLTSITSSLGNAIFC